MQPGRADQFAARGAEDVELQIVLHVGGELLHDLVIDFVDIVADHARGLAGAQGKNAEQDDRQTSDAVVL
ncbi:hypothetical protein D3C76_1240270 [compost metagenome]